MSKRKQTWKAAVSAAAIAAGAAIPMAANADTVTTNGVTWTYSVNNATAKTVTLGSGSGNGNAIGGTGTSAYAADIPWKFIGESDGATYTVTKIAAYAFKNCTKLTGNLTFPSSVTDIGNEAFNGCSGLTGLKLGPNITTIGKWAFLYCPNMVGDISDLTSVTSFGNVNVNGPFDGAGDSKGTTKIFGNIRFHPSLKIIPMTMFRNVPISSVTLPESLTSIGEAAFQSTQMKAIWLKGSVNISANYGFGDTPLEIFFAGVNTACSHPTTKRLFSNEASCKAFIPATSTWLQLDTSNAPGVEKIYYGLGRGVDIVVNAARNELTATPTNATRLVTMMEAAPLFREHFGLDTRISVTNTIDLAGVTITEAMTSAVTFDRLMFSAKTQAQLNAILGAFPATTPVSIDPTGLTENMVIPETYNNVHVKTVPGVTIKRTTKGLMILVK